jgi:hypothetical protein
MIHLTDRQYGELLYYVETVIGKQVTSIRIITLDGDKIGMSPSHEPRSLEDRIPPEKWDELGIPR